MSNCSLFILNVAVRHANRDTDHSNTLRQYFAQNRRIPSYQRIADLLGFASRAAAVKFMGRMEAEGFVVRTVDDDAWMPARRFFEHPLAQATVQAGQPTVAVDVSAEPFLFDDYLVKKPADTVVVPVQGDSMIEAGIFEGDLAVVERAASAKLGSFVVARVEDRFTLKELVKVDGAHAQPVERASHACRARARAGRDSAQAALRSRRCRGQRRVPGFGRCRLHHRRHARSQRRSGHGVNPERPPEGAHAAAEGGGTPVGQFIGECRRRGAGALCRRAGASRRGFRDSATVLKVNPNGAPDPTVYGF